MKTQVLSIDQLRINADTQARVKISEETVDDYAELIANSDGKKWPLGNLDVFHDGTDYFVADGFHRTLAAQRSKRASVPCQVHKGTAKDARIFGMTANDRHGLRMSRADKRNCVEWLLDHGGKMTQVEIATKAGVSRRVVQQIVASKKAHNAPLGNAACQKESTTSGGEVKTDTESVTASQVPPDQTPQSQASDDPAVESNTDGESARVVRSTKNGTSRETVSAANLVDAITKQHVGHIARGLTAIAQANGGEGPHFRSADAGLNQMIRGLQEMREGRQ